MHRENQRQSKNGELQIISVPGRKGDERTSPERSYHSSVQIPERAPHFPLNKS